MVLLFIFPVWILLQEYTHHASNLYVRNCVNRRTIAFNLSNHEAARKTCCQLNAFSSSLTRGLRERISTKSSWNTWELPSTFSWGHSIQCRTILPADHHASHLLPAPLHSEHLENMAAATIQDFLAIVTDATMPDGSEERSKTMNLAKDLAAAFEEEGRFETGLVDHTEVTSLYWYRDDFSDSVSFNSYIDDRVWLEGETSNAMAVRLGGLFLQRSPGLVNVMVLIVQAESTDELYAGRTAQQFADEARDDGITVLAVRGARPGEGKLPRRAGFCVLCTDPEDLHPVFAGLTRG